MLNEKARISGKNREEVDGYLEQLKQEQQAELAQIQTSLGECRFELISLQAEKQQLEAETQRCLPGARLLRVAMERLDITRQALVQSAASQIEEQRRVVEAKRIWQEQRCAELDEQMVALESQIGEMLKGVVMVAGGTPEPDVEPNPELQDETGIDNIATDVPYDVPNDISGGLTSAAPGEMADSELELESTAKGHGGDTAAEYWDQEYESMMDSVIPLPSPSPEPAPEMPAPMAEPFLEDLESGLADQENRSPEDQPASSPKSDCSPAVASEIRQVRHRYIVGKIAGGELRDAEGQLIVAKDAVITAAVIQQAEQAGKLPELIINMILPGMDQ